MDFKEDFATVDIIITSSFNTKGVDAFALSLIKSEKQIRRLFTYLIFQNPNYSYSDYKDLRTVLSNNKSMYFSHFIDGINRISPHSLEEIYGNDYYKDLQKLKEFTKDRNKIFHGQLTLNGLEYDDLILRINHIKKWCKHLGEMTQKELGFNGFSNSYKKSSLNLKIKHLDDFSTFQKYEVFLKMLQRNQY